MSQISSGFQRAGSGVVRICSHLHLPPYHSGGTPPPRAIAILAGTVASIAHLSPCVSVSLILEWSRETRASSDRYTPRRPVYTRGHRPANHDGDERDRRRMTTSFYYHPTSLIRSAHRVSILRFTASLSILLPCFRKFVRH